jgi:methyl-accepting chemotaxis protein
MDVKLLRESFDLVAPNKEQFAQDFYTRLFNVYPQTQSLFADTDMRQQQAALMGAIAGVIAGIEKGDNVVPALHKLGAKHAGYDVKPEYYPLVGTALIETFQQHLQDKFTPTIQQSWIEAYGVISEQMILGAEQTKD